MAGIKDETAEWRKFLRGVLARADRPDRISRNWTRGSYGVVYSPQESGLCTKHRFYDKDGAHAWTVFDPFCKVCYPPPSAR